MEERLNEEVQVFDRRMGEKIRVLDDKLKETRMMMGNCVSLVKRVESVLDMHI